LPTVSTRRSSDATGHQADTRRIFNDPIASGQAWAATRYAASVARNNREREFYALGVAALVITLGALISLLWVIIAEYRETPRGDRTGGYLPRQESR
jgi:hypothetical protein